MDILPVSHDVTREIKVGRVPPTIEIAKGLDALKKERAEVSNCSKDFKILKKKQKVYLPIFAVSNLEKPGMRSSDGHVSHRRKEEMSNRLVEGRGETVGPKSGKTKKDR